MNPVDPFPLGTPTNRKERPEWEPVAGRPGWVRNIKGEERYVEPPKPFIPHVHQDPDEAFE